MVRGPYQRVQYARGGRTIANPRRNEDWIIGRLAAQQTYQRLKSAERAALDSLSEGERGRPNEQHREAARSVLERERLVPPKPLKADAE